MVVVLVCTPTWAINKCTGSDGKVSYQEAPCVGGNGGQAQRVKIWDNASPSANRRDVQPTPDLKGPPSAAPMLALYRRWIDAERLAMSTSRIALSGPAANMQTLQREAEEMVVPTCLEKPHKALVSLATKSTEAILRFLGKEEVSGMLYQIVERNELIPEFERGVRNAKCEAKGG